MTVFFAGVSHGKVGTHHYFLSWREPWNKFGDWDWFNGRNFCRERCMDLISFDTPGEFKMFEEVMTAGNMTPKRQHTKPHQDHVQVRVTSDPNSRQKIGKQLELGSHCTFSKLCTSP